MSSYAAEVVRARDTLATASSRALVLVDEFARTTGPREGRALLIAFAEALRERGAFALLATHFDGVAHAAGAPHLRIAGLRAGGFDAVAADDLDAALDAIDAAMDYRVVAMPARRGVSMRCRSRGFSGSMPRHRARARNRRRSLRTAPAAADAIAVARPDSSRRVT